MRKTFQKFYSFLKPMGRVWSRKSIRTIKILLENNSNKRIFLIGSGSEPVYKKLLKPYKVIRIGLANKVDVVCDICALPFKKEIADLILSSSVLEHVYDPEKAVKELSRISRGTVYAEVPFMKSYHSCPDDYQRYTISGLKQLFTRGGFAHEESGICSGPINALILFLIDFIGSAICFNDYIKGGVLLILNWLLHPFKYLDYLFENKKWAEICALNYFFVGHK